MKTNDLVKAVVLKAALPVSRNTLLPGDIIEFLNEEMRLNVVPRLMQAQEDYLLYDYQVPIQAEQRAYTIPERAIGGKLRDLSLVDENGNFYEMARATIDDRYLANNNYADNTLYRFYVKNNQVILMGNTSQTTANKISFVYYLQPNMLVPDERCGFVQQVQYDTDINGVPNNDKVTFILDSLPINLTTGKLDFLLGNPIYSMIRYDLVPTAVNTSTLKIEFNKSDLQTSQQYGVGDYFATAKECCIPMIPEEMHTLLTHTVAARCLEVLGDVQGIQTTLAKVKNYEDNLFEVIGDRVEGSPLKVAQRHGFIRRRNYLRRGN